MCWEQISKILNDIAPLGPILLFLVTLGLLRATWKYMRATRSMADIMKSEFELRIKPYIDIRVSDFNNHDISLDYEFSFYIENKGYYPIRLIQYKIELWLKENKSESISLLSEKIDKIIAPYSPPIKEKIKLSLKKLSEKLSSRRRENIPIIIICTFTFKDASNSIFTIEKAPIRKSIYLN